jgi:hypothetical protein
MHIQVRHDKVAQLDKLKNMFVVFETSLPKSITVAIHPSKIAALKNGSKFPRELLLNKGSSVPLFLATPASKLLPKQAKAGDVLLGSLNLGKPKGFLAVAGDHTPGKRTPNEFPLRWVVPPALPKEKSKDDKSKKPENKGKADEAKADDAKAESAAGASAKPSKEDKEKEEVVGELRDLQIKYLGGLTGDKADAAFDLFFPPLLDHEPKHLGLLSLRVSHLKKKAVRCKKDTEKEEVIKATLAACDAVVDNVDSDVLAAHYGRLLPPDNEAAKKIRKDKDEVKNTFVQCYRTLLSSQLVTCICTLILLARPLIQRHTNF